VSTLICFNFNTKGTCVLSKIILIIPILFLAACSSNSAKTESGKPTASVNMIPARTPAMHAYGGFDCTAGNMKLVYDGPGSNYAFGGYSHLYSIKNGNQLKALAYQSEEGENSALGEEIADEKLEVLFAQQSSTKLSKMQTTPKKGDRCQPLEYGYLESKWKEKINIKFEQVSGQVAADFGVKAGEVRTFTCAMSSATPIQCPKSGRYRQNDLN
jgi:hypothetical protein